MAAATKLSRQQTEEKLNNRVSMPYINLSI
jgi:hypothetical protein